MTPLLLLAEKVEGLEGPDREVDCLLDRMLFDRPKNGDYCPAENAIWRVREDGSGLLVRHDGYARDSFCPARYTASVDAAMSLVPDGWDWVIYSDGSCEIGREPDPGRIMNPDYIVTANKPALAVVSASLRARAAMEAGE